MSEPILRAIGLELMAIRKLLQIALISQLPTHAMPIIEQLEEVDAKTDAVTLPILNPDGEQT